MIQATGDIVTRWILDLCNGIVKEGRIPEDWKSSVVLQFTKGKGIQWSVDLIKKLNEWNDFVENRRMRVNMNKTEVMIRGERQKMTQDSHVVSVVEALVIIQ